MSRLIALANFRTFSDFFYKVWTRSFEKERFWIVLIIFLVGCKEMNHFSFNLIRALGKVLSIFFYN